MQQDYGMELINAALRIKKTEVGISGCEISYGEYTVLDSLISCGQDECSLSHPDIQKRICITKSAVSQILNTLEKKGCIIRNFRQDDRRRLKIIITDEGFQIYDHAKIQYERTIQEVYCRYGTDRLITLVEEMNILANIFDDLREGN